jgi:dihydrolipoamide dehydrogenase
MGAAVTVVEILDRILPVEDEEISAFAASQFTAQGIALHTRSKVTSVKKTPDGVTATIATPNGEQRIDVEKVISAVGIVGNVENVGLEAAGVKVDKTHVVVNQWGETGAKGVYAIGDLVGPPWLAHKASHEGVVCVERIAGKDAHPLDVNSIPGCTYSMPQVASVGLTEAKAKEGGRAVKVGRFSYVGNGKAIALGEPEGLVKTVFDAKTGELLGAHMIGAEVTELIQGYVVAKTHETTAAALAETIFPHPTLSEMMHEVVLDALGRRIHL